MHLLELDLSKRFVLGGKWHFHWYTGTSTVMKRSGTLSSSVRQQCNLLVEVYAFGRVIILNVSILRQTNLRMTMDKISSNMQLKCMYCIHQTLGYGDLGLQRHLQKRVWTQFHEHSFRYVLVRIMEFQ